MVTQCSPLNQLRSINIDLKTRGGHTAPKTDNYTPGHQQRLHFIRSLRAIFAGQDDNEGLIAIRVREKIFNRKYFQKGETEGGAGGWSGQCGQCDDQGHSLSLAEITGHIASGYSPHTPPRSSHQKLGSLQPKIRDAMSSL